MPSAVGSKLQFSRILPFALVTLASSIVSAEPIRLHPKNPHYFQFRGRPTMLITSTEHYGAVLNPDFDFVTYLETLKAAGLNLTRTVNGNFLEATNATLWRGGDQNPLAPRRGRYLAPWKRSDQPGYHFMSWSSRTRFMPFTSAAPTIRAGRNSRWICPGAGGRPNGSLRAMAPRGRWNLLRIPAADG